MPQGHLHFINLKKERQSELSFCSKSELDSCGAQEDHHSSDQEDEHFDAFLKR